MQLFKAVVAEETLFTTYIRAKTEEQAKALAEEQYQEDPDSFSILENSHETSIFFIKE